MQNPMRSILVVAIAGAVLAGAAACRSRDDRKAAGEPAAPPPVAAPPAPAVPPLALERIRAAELAFAEERWGDALQAATDALDADPGNQDAWAIIKRVQAVPCDEVACVVADPAPSCCSKYRRPGGGTTELPGRADGERAAPR